MYLRRRLKTNHRFGFPLLDPAPKRPQEKIVFNKSQKMAAEYVSVRGDGFRENDTRRIRE
jgi:hypothetical protein